MEKSYKCKLVKSIIVEEYEEECEENIYIIFEYRTDSVNLKKITNKIFNPITLTHMDLEGLEFLGRLDESYGAIIKEFPLIEILSNTKFKLLTAGLSMTGEISEEELKTCGINSLMDLVDLGANVLLTNIPPLVAKKIVVFIPIGGIG